MIVNIFGVLIALFFIYLGVRATLENKNGNDFNPLNKSFEDNRKENETEIEIEKERSKGKGNYNSFMR